MRRLAGSTELRYKSSLPRSCPHAETLQRRHFASPAPDSQAAYRVAHVPLGNSLCDRLARMALRWVDYPIAKLAGLTQTAERAYRSVATDL